MASGWSSTTRIAATRSLNLYVAGSDLGIENTNIKTAPGVTLDEQQKTLVGSVLDVYYLFPLLSTTLTKAPLSFLLVAHR